MFHFRTSLISASLFLLALIAQPMTSHAYETSSSDVQASTPANTQANKAAFLSEDYFDELKHETKVKISGAKMLAADLERATDRLQDRVAPAGHALKKSIKTKTPVAEIAHRADQTVSVFGIILMMSFGLVLLLMSLSNPISRTGGRH